MQTSTERRPKRRGLGRSKVSAYVGSRYACIGRRHHPGCGRVFIHPGECPYCKMRLDAAGFKAS